MRPIRSYLLAVVLAATVPPALLTGVLVARAITANRTANERRLLESAKVDALAVDRQFQTVIGTLQALSTVASLDTDNYEQFYQDASRVKATQPNWFAIVLLTVDGQQVVNTRLPWGTQLLEAADPESLRRVAETRQPAVGAIRTPQRGNTDLVFAVRVPVMRDGVIRHVLSGIMRVELFDAVVPAPGHQTQEWTRIIYDPLGTIAVRTRGNDGFVGTKGSPAFLERLKRAPESVTKESTRDGLSVYAASSRSVDGWSAVVVVPRDALDGPLRASLVTLALGGILVTLGGFAAAVFASRRLSSDLDAAAKAAAAVVEGRPVVTHTAHTVETERLQRSITTTASLLERRAAERDEQLRRADAALAEAEDANRTKDQFLAVLGHELRNPLAPALTALELMKVRDPATFRREREVLERQVAHMTRLVNDLLDLSRLSRGTVQLHKEHFEFATAVERALDMSGPLIARQQHAVRVDVPDVGVVLDADRDRIVQVLCNLLSNAALYTPSGGHISVSASGTDGQLVVTVEDDGPGIPAELAASVFDAFVQGPRSLDRREGGLGLGLALARSFVEAHGGTIRLESGTGGRGCRFLVTLPLSAAGPKQVPALTSERRPQPRRVIVVDDNVDAADMLAEALTALGHDVVRAFDADRALTLLRTFRPDVAVLDIGLPGTDGYELARQARTIAPGIVLIAVTGYGQPGDVERVRAAGFSAHCVKPVNIAHLAELIEGGIRSE